MKFDNKTKLTHHTSSDHTNGKSEILTQKHSKEVSVKIFSCAKCAFKCKSKDQLSEHTKWIHRNDKEEEEFNCGECDFQGTSRLQLNKHMNLKHIGKNQLMREVIKCRNCDEQFSEKWNLMNHRKLKHPETVANCRKKQDGNCPFSDEKCWWNHQERQTQNKLNVTSVIKYLKTNLA